MPDTKLPVVRLFKDSKCVFTIFSMDADTDDNFEFPNGSICSDFDWIEFIEPVTNTPKKVLISCTANENGQKNTLQVTSDKKGFSLECHIRNFCINSSHRKSIKLCLSAYKEKGPLKTFYIKLGSTNHIDGTLLRLNTSLQVLDQGEREEDEKDEKDDSTLLAQDKLVEIHDLGFCSASRLRYFGEIGFHHKIGLLNGATSIARFQLFYDFVGSGDDPKVSALQIKAAVKKEHITESLHVTANGLSLKYNPNFSDMCFGQKARIVTQDGDEKPSSITGLWSTWSNGYKSAIIFDSWNNNLLPKYFASSGVNNASFIPQFTDLDNEIKGRWCLPIQISDKASGLTIDENTSSQCDTDPADINHRRSLRFRVGPMQPLVPVTVRCNFQKLFETTTSPQSEATSSLSARAQLLYLNTNAKVQDQIASNQTNQDFKNKDVANLGVDPFKLSYEKSSIAALIWFTVPQPPSLSPLERKTACLRLGAFELDLAKQTTDTFNKKDMPYQPQPISAYLGANGIVRLSFDCDIPLVSFRLVGQDRDPRELYDLDSSGRANETLRRQVEFEKLPILIPTNVGSAQIEGVYASVSENNYFGNEPAITLRIKTYSSTSASTMQGGRSISALILDDEPFLSAKIDAQNLFEKTQEERDLNELAIWKNWDPDGPGWKLLSKEHKIEIKLPPQVLGEEFERENDISTTNPVEFRFSPTARLSVLTGDDNFRFSESPWNLRRLLGYPSDKLLGCKLSSFQTELLYGLDCKVVTDSLYLTELFSTLGWTPGFENSQPKYTALPGQEKFFQQKVETWNLIKRSLQSRLVILQPIQQNKTNVTIEQGLDFTIRQSAELAYPIPNDVVPASDPRRSTAPFRVIVKDTDGNVIQEDGLKGGVTWGFESSNILDSVMREPKSTSGKLIDPLFSPLGGWGYQKAVFQNGLTKIYSNTSMGRTYFYSIERLGRIAIFGNLAKHVVIYERTVAPQDFSGTEKFIGYPIVRKVREFVEILEPMRQFPDGMYKQVNTGFIKAIEFKDTIINVRSEWGSDIASIGWEIPLFNWLKEVTEPNTYKKPLVVLHTITPGKEGETSEITEPIPIENPEILHFFTATSPGISDNPHKWDMVKGVDYPHFPQPNIGSDLPAHDEEFPDLILSGPTKCVPGMERFNFELTPLATQANLVAGRTNNGIAAPIRSVLLARQGKYSLPASSSSLLEQSITIDDLVDQFLSVARAAKELPIEEGRTKFKQASLKYKDKILKHCEDLKSFKQIDPVKELANLIETQISALISRLLDELEFRSNSIADRLSQELKSITLVNDVEMLHRVIAPYLCQFDAIVRHTELFAPGITPLKTELEQLNAVATEFIRTITIKINRIDEQITDTQLDIQRAICQEFLTQLKERVSSILQKVHSLNVPHFIDILNLIHTKLESLDIDSLMNAISAAMDSDNLLVAWEAVKRDVTASINSISNGFSSIETTWTNGIKGLFDQIGTFHSIVSSGASSHIKRLIDDVAAVPSSGQEIAHKLTKQFDDLKARLVAERKLIKQLIAEETLRSVEPYETLISAVEFPNWDEFATLISEASNCDSIETVENGINELFKRHVSAFQTQIAEATKSLYVSIETSSLDNSTLNLYSAICSNLTTSPLNLNRSTFRAILVNHSNEILQDTLITPSLALLSRGEAEVKELASMGTRLATKCLSNRIIPDVEFMDGKAFSDFFTDAAALKLKNCFPNLRFAKEWKDKINLQQIGDITTGRMGLKYEVKLPIPETALFEQEPLLVLLKSGTIYSSSQVLLDPSGKLSKSTLAYIKGDWLFSIADFELVEFKDTKLSFNEAGDLKFDIHPPKIQLKGVLGFISELMRNIPGAKDIFDVAQVFQNLGKPISVKCNLDTTVPRISSGCFAMAGLKLHADFGLSLPPP